ncbi:phosphoglycerate kinase [Defluviicoccus vanus]|uniref:Phosphoglycerate kinase n=1 Tax=Defluviicoccus vanus TaxID=111831 RepID=A0A7H1MXL8_9PROT|nr:phosphoglycerate kinase [Defluviicoccus vanus]QNT68204.1 phosphoglycerate kinase [Defluviicoccus vanus]
MATSFRTIDDLDVAGKRVLMRVDFNVPMKDGKVTDTTRIDRTVPSIKELTGKGAKVIILSHLGRPKGKKNLDFTQKPVAEALAAKLGQPVAFAPDCIGPDAKAVVDAMKPGDVAMLENVRFYAEEEKNDLEFAKKLAEVGDILVSDAFSCSHRAHASVEALAKLIPSAAGRLMQQEVEALSAALEAPTHPVAALVGGAKISTKLDVLGNLVEKVDQIIIGGAMANTFLAAKGVDVGKSLCEHEMLENARVIMAKAEKAGCEIVLPTDAVVAAEFKAGAPSEAVAVGAVPADKMILDVGPASIVGLTGRLAGLKTLLWNGPLGAFEIEPFDTGTNAVAQEAGKLTKAGKLLSVAGGGDTVAALAHAGADSEFSYISTAGGAFLEWLEGKTLPGVAVLRK